MIDVFLPGLYLYDRSYWNATQPNPSHTAQNKIYGSKWVGVWGKKDPLGRHPFNIITEEIYD